MAGIPIPDEVNPYVCCPVCAWSGQLIECLLIRDDCATCPVCFAAVVTVDKPVIVER